MQLMYNKSKVVFKTYNQKQAMLLPPDLDELVEQNHPVRVINAIIDHLDIDALLKKYKGGGTSSYHPRMLLKVLVYAYICNEYSSRRIEEAVKRDVQFMWLTGMAKPDHNTINRFRSERLKDVLKTVFTQVVQLLVQSGHVNLKDVYTDGTKIEANANRYTFVWGNAIKTNMQKMAQQLETIWNYAEGVACEELKDKRPTDFTPVNAEAVRQTIDIINEALKDKEVNKKVKQEIKYAAKNWANNIEKYQQQQNILGERNNYSKTDEDATFMRMKEDHMKNGQLKPGYNVQISTHNQYIVHYTTHQTTADTNTLKPHVNDFEKTHGTLPETLTADAGYGSEENYALMEEKNIEAFIKYNYFDQEQHKDKNSFHADQLHYDKITDTVICPMGQHLHPIARYQAKTKGGYVQTITKYQAKNCEGCPLRISCHKQKGNRIIEVNHTLRAYKQRASERLKSEEGITKRKQRPVDVEPVFANWKQNKGFRRFLLRGLDKITIETGLMALAHNLSKWMKVQKRELKVQLA